ncbi:MAG TPA: helix-turn-helix transcriptional regulator [Edaphocola sp.]|nr:helix-turn-helix transcriptional regulator [Edaphocola sp.]
MKFSSLRKPGVIAKKTFNPYLWTIIDKSNLSPLNTLGQILRERREAQGLLLRQVAAALEMDTALLSKFERDERKPNKEQVLAFAKYYNANADELLLAWLSDKIAGEVQNEDLAKEALKAAEKKIELFKRKNKPE